MATATCHVDVTQRVVVRRWIRYYSSHEGVAVRTTHGHIKSCTTADRAVYLVQTPRSLQRLGMVPGRTDQYCMSDLADCLFERGRPPFARSRRDRPLIDDKYVEPEAALRMLRAAGHKRLNAVHQLEEIAAVRKLDEHIRSLAHHLLVAYAQCGMSAALIVAIVMELQGIDQRASAGKRECRLWLHFTPTVLLL